MEFKSIIGQIFKYHKWNYKKIFSCLINALIGIIVLFVVYLVERYIFYNIIYYLLLIIFRLLYLEKYNIFSLKVESFFLLIYIHILLIRTIILSIIFMQGGIFKNILVYDQFYAFISMIGDYTNNAIQNLTTDNFNDIDFIMNKIDILRRSYTNLKSKNLEFKSMGQGFGICLDDSLTKYNNYKNNNSKEDIEKLIESLKNISDNLKKFPLLSPYQKIFSFNYEESLQLMEEYMINDFQTHYVEKKNICKNFDIYLLSPKNPQSENKDFLTIFCNQNAVCCECYSMGKDNIIYYLNELNCPVIIWNYKGFGLRKGFTTFGNIDKDVNILSDYIKKNYNKYKIIIHGCSIGGYPSIKLMQKINIFNDALLICDRTFGDIKNIVQTLKYHRILSVLYSMILPQCYFKYRNIENYISLPYDKKIILFDEFDQIIKYNPSSLVFNITQKYYIDVVKPKLSKYKEYFSLFKNIRTITEQLKKLANDCNDEKFDKNGRIFIQYLNYYINSIEEFFMFFIIFGYPFNRFKEINFHEDKLKDVYIKLPFIFKKFMEKNDIQKEIVDAIAYFNYLFVKFNLNCKISDDDILKYNYEKSGNCFWSK